MLLTNCYKNIFCASLRNLNVGKNTKPLLHNYNHIRTRLLNKLLPNVIQCRNYNEAQNLELPSLTDEPKLVWPSFFNSIRNFVQCNFVIKSYMEPDFNLPEFLEGSKQVSFASEHNMFVRETQL